MDTFNTQPLGGQSLDVATREKLASPPPVASGGGPGAVAPPPFTPEGSFFSRNRWYIFLSVIALVVIGVLVFFALRKPSAPKQPKVTVQLVVPEEIPSSSEAVVKAVISNQDSQAITNGKLELVYPNGAVFVSSTPAADNLSGTQFTVPDMSAGTNVTVFVKLKFEGGVGLERSLSARLSYRLSGISAEFAAEARTVARLVAAGVTIDIQGPVTGTSGQVATYVLHYANQSTQTFDKVRIRATYPSGFQFGNAAPSPSQGSDTWDIGQLTSGGSGDITINGALPSISSGQGVAFKAEVLVPDKTGGFYAQAQSEFTTSIGQQPLLVTQTVQTPDQIAKPGDIQQYHIEYQNNTTTAARGVRIVFTVDSNTADLSTIQAEGASVSGNSVTWTASSYAPLEVVSPGQKGSVDVAVRLKKVVVQDRSTNPVLTTSVQIKSDEYDTFLPGNKVTVKIGTEFSLEGAASYADGQRPPRVGQESRYTVTLSLKNSTSEVSGGVLTLFVGSGNNGFDKNSLTPGEADKVTYDASTGKLTWRIDNVRAHTGDFAPARTLQFTLKFVPASSSAGKPVVLAKNIQFSGKDNHTGTAITAAIAQVTTSDAGSDGIVVQ